MTGFDEARDALAKVVKRVFPDAQRVEVWKGVPAWAAPRPKNAIVHGSTGTYDPARTVIGIADRKAGPTIYFLDPGDYDVLETHRELLEGAGMKLGRGCLYPPKKGPLPVDALEELFRRVKARDEAAGKPAKA